MIKIDKPREAPGILKTKGKNKRRGLSLSYTRNYRDYDTGQKRFSFDSSIYAHPTVKQVLIDAQHGKCCFCESKLSHISYGDVEHFRPKAGYRQDASDDLQRPGYYWLAYEWENLLLSCTLCNQRYKGNLFPLRDPSHRARNHRDDINGESPLFIHPAEDRPEELIAFRAEIPYAVDGNPSAAATIANLALDRGPLMERRREKWMYLRKMHEIIRIAECQPSNSALQRIALEAREFLERSIADEAEYAGMARAATKNM